MITVIKLGGNIIDDENLLGEFLKQFSDLTGKFILVHGGGKSATSFSAKLGIESKMINGRRVTDAETLKIITMVYAGWINKSIVAKLQSMNCNAIGLSGADGNLIQSKKRSAIPFDYGFVGDPLAVNIDLLLNLLNNKFIPVIAPVTHDSNGQLLNTNADTIASVIAAALSTKEKVQLIYCFEKNGVLQNSENDQLIFSELTKEQTKQFSEKGKIHSGMIPKLKASFSAKENGVDRVVIGNAFQLEMLVNNTSQGTLIL